MPYALTFCGQKATCNFSVRQRKRSLPTDLTQAILSSADKIVFLHCYAPHFKSFPTQETHRNQDLPASGKKLAELHKAKRHLSSNIKIKILGGRK